MNLSHSLNPILAVSVLAIALNAVSAFAAPAKSTLDQTGMTAAKMSGNPIFPGYYADPEGILFDKTYWIYPTYSADYDDQTHFDAFSSPDMVTWTKHPNILTVNDIGWAKRAMWAPSIIRKDGKYFFFFGANDIQNSDQMGGIGVAVADKPEGPYKDHIGKPLIDRYYNGAQPIDQFVFHDKDDQYYLIYGGHSHCNIAKLSDDFKSIVPMPDGEKFKEITPENYVEGPFMFIRNGKYYFMWSEGGWTGPNYSVAYAVGDSPFGPFQRVAKVLQPDPTIAFGAGHHSVIRVPGKTPDADRYFMVYHRRPVGTDVRDSRVTCIDEMFFDKDGNILPIKMTNEGVAALPIP